MIKKYNQIFVSFSAVSGDVLKPLLGARAAGSLLSFAAKKGLFVLAFSCCLLALPPIYLPAAGSPQSRIDLQYYRMY